MEKLEILDNALEYMEQHLEEDIRTEDIAKICYCSKSTLEKLFCFVNDVSVRDYLIRRRMTKAANLELFTFQISDEKPGFGTFSKTLYAYGVGRCMYGKTN